MTITKDFVADYSAVGDGSTDNATAADNFRTFARAQSETVVLTIPNGHTYYSTNGSPFDGIKSLIVEGVGGGTKAKLTGEWTFLSCLAGFSQKANRTARIRTAFKGETSVFCKTKAQADFFTEEHIVAIGSQEWQGDSGYPPNPQNLQFLRVLSKNATTGEVKFYTALTRDYFDHFIDTHTPGQDYDTGGPATLYVMRDPENGTGGLEGGFDLGLTLNGLHFNTPTNSANGQIYTRGLSVIANDVTCTDCCLIPTNAKYIQYNNLNVTGLQMEVDKNVEYVELNDCSLRAIDFQSASVMRSVFRRVTCSNFWHGTGRKVEMYDCMAPDFTVGCNGYGSTEQLIAKGCEFPDAIGWVSSHKSATSNFSLSGGFLTYNGSGVLPFPAEGSALFLAGQMSSNFEHVGYTRRVGSVIDNGSGFPKIECTIPTLSPSFLTGTVYVVNHPCLDVTLIDCTSNGAPLAYSDGPRNKPLFSYGKIPSQSFETQTGFTIWGTIQEIRINVLRAYTGAQATCEFHLGGAFGNIPNIHADGVNAGFDFDFVVNAKITGERVITSSSITGGQSGDTGTPPGALWLMSDVRPKVTADMSGDTALQKPLIELTVKTDQGISIVNRTFTCSFS